ncbi:DUF4422 domain-containing protein [Bifidobacterium sp. UTBIF-78]|uniref:DUF4422 domain-containing protein n=1 Tax=Bifidobacterium sp. UTBIF-78 TaxID=1465263 RepID=UPI001127F25C|nr:DUF4422 domain-containing protein [Bifidobacterium sp. UTBIF-78]TPF92101.1 glycosyltransferase [Bifidobacterium sp. UTBIF-78]
MPTLSIVIPAYNKAEYLDACLTKLEQQTFPDIEIVVVNDKSPDNTRDVVLQHQQKDRRVVLVDQPENMGTLVARKTGALHTQGRYVTFMDQDDELVPDACERMLTSMSHDPVDILHFGVQVDAANDLAAEAAAGMTGYMTPKPRELYGSAILETVFADDGYDWNVHHKLYRGNLVRSALADVEDARLTRPDDAYLYFAIASCALSYRALPDSPWYIYHLGRGVTLGDTLTLDVFDDISSQNAKALSLVQAYVESHGDSPAQRTALRRLRTQLVSHTMNEWKDNIAPADKRAAFVIAARAWGAIDLAGELYRFINDDAYRARQHLFDKSDQSRQAIDNVDLYRQLLDGLDLSGEKTQRFSDMQRAAQTQLQALDRSKADKERQDGSSIRIFVSTHKDVDYPHTAILQPIQVGAVTAANRFPDMLHDDQGDNISDRNPRYCELTAQYWAWKNVDAEYYGFCHYRRYFDFSETPHEENIYGEIMDDYIDDHAIREYRLDDASMAAAIKGYDVITTPFSNLTAFVRKNGTPKGMWHAAPKLHDRDLRACYDILCRMHPDYKQDADAFLAGKTSCFCNMFIMRKRIFFDYCEWLFPILQRFEEVTGTMAYSKEALRTPGHLSERLLNIYLLHHRRTNAGWKMKQLQCVHFTNPERETGLEPLQDIEPERIVPVIFAADDNYAPQLATTIYSAMSNADTSRHYDVVVLQRNISWDKQERMRAFFSRFPNMTLRFTNVDRMITGYNLTTNNEHISVETYYRFLIQQVLPFYDKVLYLDSDIIITGDIAELYDTELGDNLLAAVHDVDYLGNLNIKDGIRMKYTKQVLGMTDPYSYFQAGVLVLNTQAMREHYSFSQWLEYASDASLIYNDQDVLNVHCEGKVTYLPWEWNVVHDCANRVANVFSFAPNDAYDAYIESREHPKIIHYAGFIKPWTDPDCDFASIYWRYARETPFYERLLKKVSASVVGTPRTVSKPRHERAVAEKSPIRKIVDPIAPIGSERRELLKAVGRLVRHRK